MEPFDDSDLHRLLRQWEAPGAPPRLRDRVMERGRWSVASRFRRRPGVSGFSRAILPTLRRTVRWLLTGTIRVPVPVGVAAAAVLAIWMYAQLPSPPVTAPPTSPVTLADFQPVPRLEPRIVGER